MIPIHSAFLFYTALPMANLSHCTPRCHADRGARLFVGVQLAPLQQTVVQAVHQRALLLLRLRRLGCGNPVARTIG